MSWGQPRPWRGAAGGRWKRTLGSVRGGWPITLPWGCEGMGPTSFHFPRSSPEQMWGASCLTCGAHSSLWGPRSASWAALPTHLLSFLAWPIMSPFMLPRAQHSWAPLHCLRSSWGPPCTSSPPLHLPQGPPSATFLTHSCPHSCSCGLPSTGSS